MDVRLVANRSPQVKSMPLPAAVGSSMYATFCGTWAQIVQWGILLTKGLIL